MYSLSMYQIKKILTLNEWASLVAFISWHPISFDLDWHHSSHANLNHIIPWQVTGMAYTSPPPPTAYIELGPVRLTVISVFTNWTGQSWTELLSDTARLNMTQSDSPAQSIQARHCPNQPNQSALD